MRLMSAEAIALFCRGFNLVTLTFPWGGLGAMGRGILRGEAPGDLGGRFPVNS